jgi:hypothetical protein
MARMVTILRQRTATPEGMTTPVCIIAINWRRVR